jgi:hypothetical protein
MQAELRLFKIGKNPFEKSRSQVSSPLQRPNPFKHTTTTRNQTHTYLSTSKMQLFNLMLVAAASTLSVEACKCVNPNGGANNVDRTRFCCKQNSGTFVSDDCRAGSISNRLSNFKTCCRGKDLNSDCSCPTCREETGIESVTNITTVLS